MSFLLASYDLLSALSHFPNNPPKNISVKVSTSDFRGFRTAMFGKTRLGKSNVVKIIAQSIIETITPDKSVGQLIFDVNGEYANDNPQDGSKSLRSAYPDKCEVFALTNRPKTPSHPLRLNFYEQPDSCIQILRSLLKQSGRTSQYIESFSSVEMPNVNEIKQTPLDESKKTRLVRRVQMYWAILAKAGFEADEGRLRKLGLKGGGQYAPANFDPHFNQETIKAVYGENHSFTKPTNLEKGVTSL